MENMTKTSYSIAIKKLLKAYHKKWDCFGRERKKTKRRKNGKLYYYINNYWNNFSNNCRNILMDIHKHKPNGWVLLIIICWLLMILTINLIPLPV